MCRTTPRPRSPTERAWWQGAAAHENAAGGPWKRSRQVGRDELATTTVCPPIGIAPHQPVQRSESDRERFQPPCSQCSCNGDDPWTSLLSRELESPAPPLKKGPSGTPLLDKVSRKFSHAPMRQRPTLRRPAVSTTHGASNAATDRQAESGGVRKWTHSNLWAAVDPSVNRKYSPYILKGSPRRLRRPRTARVRRGDSAVQLTRRQRRTPTVMTRCFRTANRVLTSGPVNEYDRPGTAH